MGYRTEELVSQTHQQSTNTIPSFRSFSPCFFVIISYLLYTFFKKPLIKCCILTQVFGEALTTACNALAVFATQDSSLTGTGAKLSQTGRDTLHAVLSACMGVVSPCVLVCAVVHDLATVISSGSYKGDGKEEKAVMRVQQCQAAVVRSASKLGQALGNGTDQR